MMVDTEDRNNRLNVDLEAQHNAATTNGPNIEFDEEEKRSSDVDYDGSTQASTNNSEGSLEKGVDDLSDPNIVWWDGPDDPENPMNWSRCKKGVLLGVSSAVTFVSPLASSIFAPAIPEVMNEFHSQDKTLATFLVSIFILGFAIGPLFLSPASEHWGRAPIYYLSSSLFFVCCIACALSNSMGMLLFFRFLSGAVGSAPLSIGGALISDTMIPEQRGVAMALWALGPIIGPVVGPIAGGYIAQATTWRWAFWVLSIFAGIVCILTIAFLRETYAPAILEAKARRLRKQTGNQELRSKLSCSDTPSKIFINAIVRPMKILLFSPIVFLFSLFMAVTYGYIYILFTSFPFVFKQQYGFSIGSIGLSYLGIGVGLCIGLAVIAATSDRIYVSLKAKNNGIDKPEYRLPPMTWISPLIPVGFFIYGWTAEKQVHWILPIFGTSFVGLGMVAVYFVTQSYIVDAFTQYAASAIAAATVLRSLVGAFLPLAGPKMYSRLGLGWGNTLLAFIALVLCAVPFGFERWGERIRRRFIVKL